MIQLPTLLLAGCLVATSSSFAIRPSFQSTWSSRLYVTRDEYLQPHFEAPPSVVDMDRMVHCAETTGECSVTEMIRMMEGMQMIMVKCQSGIEFDTSLSHSCVSTCPAYY